MVTFCSIFRGSSFDYSTKDTCYIELECVLVISLEGTYYFELECVFITLPAMSNKMHRHK